MGSIRARRYPGVIVGGLLLTGMGLGIAPAHAAVDGRCTVAAVPSAVFRIASPTLVREGPADACVLVRNGRVVDATSLRPLLAAKALVAAPRATPRPAPVPARPVTPAPVPSASTSPKPSVPAVPVPPATPSPSTAPPAPTVPGSPSSTAPAVPGSPTTPPTTPAGGSVLPGAPALPPSTALPPAGSPGTAGAPSPLLPSRTTPAGGVTLLSPRTGTVAGDRLGVDLLAPVGGAPVLDGIPDTPLVAPEQAQAPEMVALRNLGESDPTGVHSETTTEALAAQHRPGLFSAALGAAILAGLAGFAVRHRVFSRYRRRPAPSAAPTRLVEVSVRTRPDA